jgi:hypothetical protein
LEYIKIYQSAYNLHFDNKKWLDCQFNKHILIFIPWSFNSFWFIIIKKWNHFKCILFSVKCKLWSGLEKTGGLSALLMLIFARSKFDSVIYCNFCSFWVSFLYWWWFVVVLHLKVYLNLFLSIFVLFLSIFVLMELFTLQWKTCFVEKFLPLTSVRFIIDIIFFMKKKFYFLVFFLRIRSLAIFLYFEKNFFNNFKFWQK